MGGDYSSLKFFIERYGKEDGTRRYNEKREKLSMFFKGKPSSRKGFIHTKESREKCSNSVKNNPYHLSIKGKTYEEIYGIDARGKLKERMKGIFSLEWFCDKYGLENGLTKYKERSRRISETTFFKIFNKMNKNNFSKVSQELFWNILKECSLSKNDVYFAELNHEYSCKTGKFNYDFVLLSRKKVIEFNGDKFHANPLFYKSSEKPNPYVDITSEEIWKFDEKKIMSAKERGFDVFIVWENEYKTNKEETLDRCLKFLEE